jgi:hypothetical protein
VREIQVFLDNSAVLRNKVRVKATMTRELDGKCLKQRALDGGYQEPKPSEARVLRAAQV